MTTTADPTTVQALSQAIVEAFTPAPEVPAREAFTPTPEQARTIARNHALQMDAEALAVQQRVGPAFLLAGQGHAPAPAIGQNGSDYTRQSIAALKNCAGLSALDTTPLGDRAVSYLLDSVLEKIDENWSRPYDLAPGAARTVSVPDESGFDREILTTVFGRGTPSVFRAMYADLLAPSQVAVAMGGDPIHLS